MYLLSEIPAHGGSGHLRRSAEQHAAKRSLLSQREHH